MKNEPKIHVETPLPRNTTDCRVCKQEIKVGARKCIHCESYQDWRRHIGLGNNVLALLVALLSILTVLIPVIAKAFITEDAVISGSVIDVHIDPYKKRIIYLSVINSGNRPATIGTSVSLEATAIDGKKYDSWPARMDIGYIKDGSGPIVEPGKGKVVFFEAGEIPLAALHASSDLRHEPEKSNAMANVLDADCTCTIEVFSAASGTRDMTIQFPCKVEEQGMAQITK
jgi:hypothetical protein